MSESALSMLLITLMTQMPVQMPEPPTEETIRMVAVQASTQGGPGKSIPEALRYVRNVLEQLPFDTFQPIADHEEKAPYGKETHIPINDTYSFYFQPNAQGEEPGSVAFSARVEMQEEPEPINALMANGRASPEKTLLFRGLDANVGEVLVLFKLVQAPQENQEPSQDNQDQQQQQQPEPSDKQQDKGAQQEPNDLQGIEAILQSLEEMDRREQEESKERPAGVLVPGAGWW